MYEKDGDGLGSHRQVVEIGEALLFTSGGWSIRERIRLIIYVTNKIMDYVDHMVMFVKSH